MHKWFLILLFPLISQCKSATTDRKTSNLTYLYSRDSFQINIPDDWKYIKEHGEDSFIGLFVSQNDTLNFDCSRMGYANHLNELSAEENIHIDSTSNFVMKVIWPKIVGKGITGVYIHSRKSNLNFQMNGKNLSAKGQKLALKAFKTIILKDQ
jgi:hypothetical protein